MKLQKRRILMLFLAVTITLVNVIPGSTVLGQVSTSIQGDPIVIVLDPGHGGGDGGACRKWSGKTYREKTINFTIAKACKKELEKYTGVEVYLTRTTDSYVSLDDRVRFAKKRKADLYVSLHNNASLSSSVCGACVYYPNRSYQPDISSKGKRAAQCIQSRLAACGLKNNGISYRNTEVRSRYPDQSLADYYRVIKQSKLAGFPGLIVEHAYISNVSDCKKFLGSTEKLKKLGKADAKGIADYFGLTQMSTPQMLSVDANEDGSVTVKWKPVENAGGYLLYRRKKGEQSYQKIMKLNDGSIENYTDASVEPETVYEYAICAYHKGPGATSYTELSDVLEVMTDRLELPPEDSEQVETEEVTEEVMEEVKMN
ncbi:MAG: N-acetylmuramoyl-L-alanine amidase [Lachnospiraceae bacterium]|nr:N-acetylmuramoyl-L-alanine amidase [Agathobacter sp.]MDD6290515.1 N-acetylmuramoyl-L-alanine amidase [Lachnospiraceae bacterium]